MLYALQEGYVLVTPTGVYYPGFQRQISVIAAVAKNGDVKACA